MKIYKYLLGSLGILLFFTSTSFSSDVLLMPQELYNIAVSNSCQQVDDYYLDRPGPVTPLYVYGITEGKKHESAAFWCQRTTNKSKVYVLMFMIRDSELGARYAGEITWDNYPRGLSVYNGKREVRNPVPLIERKKLPNSERLIGKGVLSSYDGVSELFINQDGVWYVKQWH
jgi:hypothetical protein